MLYVSNLSICVCELQRWHEQKHPVLSKLSWWPTARQTDKEDLHLNARSKTVIVSFLSSLVSWRTSQTVGDRTLLQIWRPRTTLSIWYITINKRIHEINAYFFAAASNKRSAYMLTSLCGKLFDCNYTCAFVGTGSQDNNYTYGDYLCITRVQTITYFPQSTLPIPIEQVGNILHRKQSKLVMLYRWTPLIRTPLGP